MLTRMLVTVPSQVHAAAIVQRPTAAITSDLTASKLPDDATQDATKWPKGELFADCVTDCPIPYIFNFGLALFRRWFSGRFEIIIVIRESM